MYKNNKRRKKILFIVEAMGGGVFTYIVDLANELVNDFELYILYNIRPQTPKNYKAYFDSRIYLMKAQHFTRAICLMKDVKSFFEIQNIVKRIQPDIVHLHSAKSGVIGRWALNGHKVQMFYTPHGYSFLMLNYSVVKRSIYKFIEAISAKRYCTTISCSEGEHQETLKLTKRAVYVNNGINISKLDELLKCVDRENHPFTVFTLGRICHQKNPSMFNAIAEAMPDIHFLWIGEGNELMNTLVAKNIKITGWVDRVTALKMSMNADVFLLTSLWEGLPISLLESMYMKKPCVVSDVIGNHDVIHNYENGFVCKEVNEFVNAIEKCRRGEAEQYVEKASIDLMANYTTQVMVLGYKQIFGGGYKLIVFVFENTNVITVSKAVAA